MPSILIVDDDESIRRTLSRILESEGYETSTAGDGDEAIAVLKERKFDVMVSDIRMPHIDGMHLASAAHRRDPHMAVVMLTGYATMETAMESLKYDVFDYLLKPPRSEDLLACISRAAAYSQALVAGITGEQKAQFERERDKSLKRFLRSKEGKRLEDGTVL